MISDEELKTHCQKSLHRMDVFGKLIEIVSYFTQERRNIRNEHRNIKQFNNLETIRKSLVDLHLVRQSLFLYM